MTTIDKTVLGVVIIAAVTLASYQYWHMLEPLRLIASVLATGKA